MKNVNKRVEEYLELLWFIVENNLCAPNNIVNLGGIDVMLSYAGAIAERDAVVLKEIAELIDEKKYFVAAFLLRDLIENIKVYLYLMRGFNDEKKLPELEKLDDLEKWWKNRPEKQIADKFSTGKNWDFNINEIIERNKSLKIWEDELAILKEMNDCCDKIIHKNGYVNFRPGLIGKETVSIEKALFASKFFVTLVIYYDGFSLRSDDYIEALENGRKPEKGSELCVAPIVQKFISEEYSKEEKEKLKTLCYMKIE